MSDEKKLQRLLNRYVLAKFKLLSALDEKFKSGTKVTVRCDGSRVIGVVSARPLLEYEPGVVVMVCGASAKYAVSVDFRDVEVVK